VKTRAPMNPRDPDKRNTRTYLRWGERNVNMKITQNNARGRAGKPKYQARVNRWDANRRQAQQRGQAYDRWIQQDDKIERWLDE